MTPETAHRFRSEDVETPEFLIWCIDRACPIREPLDRPSPSSCGHFLRPLAAISYCQNSGTMVDGVCLDPRALAGQPRGFFASEVGSFYGGLDSCRQGCHACPANCRQRTFDDFDPLPPAPQVPSLAGCYGWLRFDPATVAQIDELGKQNQLDQPPTWPTRPLWYGYWLADRLSQDSLGEWHQILGQLLVVPRTTSEIVRAEISDLYRAVDSCRRNQLNLSVELIPRGRTRGTAWIIGPHCRRCKAPMEESQSRCGVCQLNSRPHPSIKRKRMGFRPFLHLDALLGSERARQIGEKRQKSPGPLDPIRQKSVGPG